MTTTTRPDGWLSVHEASELLGVSTATLRRWSAAGEIEAFVTPGGHRRYARSAITDLVARSCPSLAAEVGDEERDAIESRRQDAVERLFAAGQIPDSARGAVDAMTRSLVDDIVDVLEA